MPSRSLEVAALVFDAYGTLFDVHSVTTLAEELAPGRGAALSQLWRTKQLEYTWQRSLMDRYVDFWRVTSDGLDFALDQNGINDPALRDDLVRRARQVAETAGGFLGLGRVSDAEAKVLAELEKPFA